LGWVTGLVEVPEVLLVLVLLKAKNTSKTIKISKTTATIIAPSGICRLGRLTAGVGAVEVIGFG
jgi:hypothetical protein